MNKDTIDAQKTGEINLLVKENNALRAALTDFVRDAQFRSCEDATPGLLLRLAKGRTALVATFKSEPSPQDELRAVLKETLDALLNETVGKPDSPWIASVKTNARNAIKGSQL